MPHMLARLGIPSPKMKSGALATPKTPENRGNTESPSASDNLNSTLPGFRKIKTPATASKPRQGQVGLVTDKERLTRSGS
jgi:hypothetical protein